jgi:NhaP-type Na+/H+ or K+/H+ antiporter
MRVLKLAATGVLIWGLSLLWPEASQLFLQPMMMGITLGLLALVLASVLVRRLDRRRDGAGQDHPSHPRPVALTH